MTLVSKWFKKNMPGAWNFFVEFFEAMNTRNTGQSLRKWLAVGFFWNMYLLTMKFGTKDNVVAILGIDAGMITALVITYSVTSHKAKKPDSSDLTNTLDEPK